MLAKALKCQKKKEKKKTFKISLPRFASTSPRETFHKCRWNSFPHLQIWFHKRVNIHKRAAEGEEGIRAEKARHAGTDTLRSICSFISSVSIFMTFQQSCFKRNPTKADYSATNTPASEKKINKKKKAPSFCLLRFICPPPFLWSSFCLCCEPRKREVTFSINHGYRKLLLSGGGGGERTDTQLFDDWSKSCKVWITLQ